MPFLALKTVRFLSVFIHPLLSTSVALTTLIQALKGLSDLVEIPLSSLVKKILIAALDIRVVNNTGKKYCNIQYQYQAKKVLPIPIPITP